MYSGRTVSQESINRVFIDELEAAEVGSNWLHEIISEIKDKDSLIEILSLEGGGIKILWSHSEIVAYFLIIRNDKNNSILITNDLRI